MSLLFSSLEALKALFGFLKISTLMWKVLCHIPTFRGEPVNYYALPDEDFIFLCHLLRIVQQRVYYPTSTQETNRCDSLCNYGVLRRSAGGYKLTWTNRHLFQIQSQ